MTRLAIIFLAGALAAIGQVRSVYVTAPDSRLTSGGTMTLAAAAADANGNVMPNAVIAWSSSSDAILSVDKAGVVTAKGLGIADIAAVSSNVRSTVRIQVLPQSIELTPGDTEIMVGDNINFTAKALDLKGQTIPNVTFTWGTIAADGFSTVSVGIDRNGKLSSFAVGTFVVRAYVSYSAGPGQFIPQFFGTAALRVKSPKQWRLSRVVGTNDVRNSALLLPRRNLRMSVNESGQIAFMGSLEGFAAGLMLWDQNAVKVLASSGTPTLIPGTFLYDCGEPALNNRGDVVAACNGYGLGTSLLSANSSGNKWILLNSYSEGGYENITGITLTRYSLNDNGEILFRATFRYEGMTTTNTGLFRRTADGALILEYATDRKLPGLEGTISLDTDFGIDNQSNIYFLATNGTLRNLYRKDATGQLVRMLGTGDDYQVLNQKITRISNITVSPYGHFAYYVNTNNYAYVVSVKKDDPDPKIVNVSANSLLGISPSGTVVFRGDYAPGTGIYTWDGTTLKDVFIINHPAPNGELFVEFDSAGINGAGEVYAQARTSNNLFVVAKASPKTSLVFQSGIRIAATANPVFLNFAQGARVGPAHLLTGGNSSSIMEVSGSNLLPKVMLGDRLPDGGFYEAGYTPRKAANGDLYVTTGSSLHRLGSDNSATLISRFPARMGSITINAPFTHAATSKGLLVTGHTTSVGINRLVRWDNGQPVVLAHFGSTNPSYKTDSPSGGNFEALNDMLIDEGGRVLANIRANNGPSGLFIYADGAWTNILKLNESEMLGRAVTAINLIRTGGEKFYAYLTLFGGIPVIAEWRDGKWVSLLTRSDQLPSGNVIDGVSTFDVNSKGDVAVRVSGAGTTLLLCYSKGEWRTVANFADPQETGDFLRSVDQIDLRDDGTIYFLSLSYQDEYVAYVAERLF